MGVDGLSPFRGVEEKVRKELAEDPKTPPEILHLLAKGEVEVRARVAGNPNAKGHILLALGRDVSQSVRKVVAGNPSCPRELLEKLSREDSPEVRIAAILNPALPLPSVVRGFLEGRTVCERRLYVRRLLLELDRLPQDPNLWLELWACATEEERKGIEAHPFGAQIGLLARLGGER